MAVTRQIIDRGHFGEFTSAAELPNVLGSPNQVDNLRAGDVATVGGQLYSCLTDTKGAAVWGPDAAVGGSVRRITDADAPPGDPLVFEVLPGDINGTIQLTATSEDADVERTMILPVGEIGDRLTVQFTIDLFNPVPASNTLVLGAVDLEAYAIVLDSDGSFYEGLPLGSAIEIVRTGTIQAGPEVAYIWSIVNGRGAAAAPTVVETRQSLRSEGTTSFATESIGNFAGGGSFAATVAVYLTAVPSGLEVIAGLWRPGEVVPGWFVGVDGNRWRAGHQDLAGTLSTNTAGAALVPATINRLNIVTFMRYGGLGHLIVNGALLDTFSVDTDAADASDPAMLLRANSVGTPYWFESGGLVGFQFMEAISFGSIDDTIAAFKYAQLTGINRSDLGAFHGYFGQGSYYTIDTADSPFIVDQEGIRSSFAADPSWPGVYGYPNLWV